MSNKIVAFRDRYEAILIEDPAVELLAAITQDTVVPI